MGQPIKVRALKWIVGHDTGLSSEAIWAHMIDAGEPKYGWSYPSDPDDLGRCLRLLELIPEWKPRLPEMATRSPIWKSLIAQWDQLKESMDQEVGIDWSKGREAIKTYNLMKSIISDTQ